MTAAINEYLARLQSAGWDTSRYLSGSLESIKDTVARRLPSSDPQSQSFCGVEMLCEYFTRISAVRAGQGATLDQLVLLPEFIPLGLDEAFDLWEFFSIDPQMQRGFFPIMHDYGGNYLCVDILAKSRTNGKVFECIQECFPWPLYQNIEALFRIHSIAVERSVIFVEAGRYLSDNPQEMSRLIDSFPSLATNPPD